MKNAMESRVQVSALRDLNEYRKLLARSALSFTWIAVS